MSHKNPSRTSASNVLSMTCGIISEIQKSIGLSEKSICHQRCHLLNTINNCLLSLSHQRQRWFHKYRNSGSRKSKQRYYTLMKRSRKLCKQAMSKYLKMITKKFLKYVILVLPHWEKGTMWQCLIVSRKQQYWFGSSHQFYSVQMPPITISAVGIQKLLLNLRGNKAGRPDQLLPRLSQF